jgi:hypothetical protein
VSQILLSATKRFWETTNKFNIAVLAGTIFHNYNGSRLSTDVHNLTKSLASSLKKKEFKMTDAKSHKHGYGTSQVNWWISI